MAIALATPLAQQVQNAAKEAGLAVVEGVEAAGFNGIATEKYTLMLLAAADGRNVSVETTADAIPGNRSMLELSAGFDLQHHAFTKTLHEFLLETARRPAQSAA